LTGWKRAANGRIICYDPNTNTTRTVLRGLKFPNGICIASDGQSILFAETFGCCIKRYWFDGPKSGTVETVIDNLPGYPDNINLASDGNYWLAMVGNAQPRARSRLEDAGLPPAHGQAGPDRRVAVPEHQHRMRDQVQRARRSARILLGTCAASTIR